ncbi:MAG: ComF family protein [Agarilytica sp.]
MLDLAFPKVCHLCLGTCNSLLCDACEDSLTENSGCRCQQCDLPLKTESILCAACLKKTPSFSVLHSAWVYTHPLDQLIHHFKDKQAHFWGRYLGEKLISRIYREYKQDKPDLVIAVPIHWSKQLVRGFNQSQILAQLCAKTLNLPISTAIRKTSRTADQKNLSRHQRIFNLKKSFKVTRNVEGLHIALVDDVVTTGATVETLSRLLLNAGAARVDVWALARTPRTE